MNIRVQAWPGSICTEAVRAANIIVKATRMSWSSFPRNSTFGERQAFSPICLTTFWLIKVFVSMRNQGFIGMERSVIACEPVLGPRDAEGLQGHRNKILNDLWAKVIENVDFVAFAEKLLSK
ncbi:MAG: hypothetical protein WBW81_13180 [Methylocella sp.]